MPPRKSTDSASAAQNKSGDGDAASAQPKGRGRRGSDSLGVEDLNLPRSMVQRLAKGMLPPNTSIHKEALLAMSKSATVFVNYLASNANDRAVLNNKKTIQPNDVFDALDELEFPDFLPRVKSELEIWNTAQCDKRNSYRRRIREEAAAKDGTALPEANGVNGSATHGASKHDGSPPLHKKARLSAATAANDEDDMVDDADEGDIGDDTVDENEGEEYEDNVDEDEDMEDDAADDDEQEDGLAGDMGHNDNRVDEDDYESD